MKKVALSLSLCFSLALFAPAIASSNDTNTPMEQTDKGKKDKKKKCDSKNDKACSGKAEKSCCKKADDKKADDKSEK